MKCFPAYHETCIRTGCIAAFLLMLANSAPAAELPFWFPVGERLEYRIYWGILPVGSALVETRWVDEDGRKLLSIRYQAKANAFFNRIYRVDDKVESLVDPMTFLPVQLRMCIARKAPDIETTTLFDHAAGQATWKSNAEHNNSGVLEIGPDTRDIVSFMYFLRKEGMQPESQINNRIVVGRYATDILLNAGKIESVKLPEYGKIDSLKVEPHGQLDAILVDEGFATAWISQDSRRICTKMYIKAPLGRARVILSSVRGSGDDFWVTNPVPAQAESR